MRGVVAATLLKVVVQVGLVCCDNFEGLGAVEAVLWGKTSCGVWELLKKPCIAIGPPLRALEWDCVSPDSCCCICEDSFFDRLLPSVLVQPWCCAGCLVGTMNGVFFVGVVEGMIAVEGQDVGGKINWGRG